MILDVVTLTSTPSITNFLVRFSVLLEKFCKRQEVEVDGELEQKSNGQGLGSETSSTSINHRQQPLVVLRIEHQPRVCVARGVGPNRKWPFKELRGFTV